MAREINNIHDKFFKTIFSDIEIARDFILFLMPKKISGKIDMQSLKFSTSSFTDEKLSEQFCDIVINAGLNNVDKDNCNIHILLEHKSYKDKNLNVQILAYLVNILQNQISTKNIS